MDNTKSDFLLEKLKSNQILIAAHRGTHGANIIQSTSTAFENSILHGADIIEFDVIKSTDGIFYAFNNLQTKGIFGYEFNIFQLSSKEIESLHCLNYQMGRKIHQRLERVDDILKRFKDRVIINIDRSWLCWNEFLEYLATQDYHHQIILKCHISEEYLSVLEKYQGKFMFMGIVNQKEELNLLRKFNVNTIALELIFHSLSDEIVQPAYLQWLKSENYLLWVNTIMIADQKVLSGGLTDNEAILNGFSSVYGTLINMGFDMIQTDWPHLVFTYRKKIFPQLSVSTK